MESFINQIIHGDCLEVMKDLPDQSIDMILCDLPYGTTACKWDSVIPFDPLWSHYKRLIKPNGAIVLTASQPFTSTLITSNIKMFRYCWVWQKNCGSNFATARKMPFKEHEDICVFGLKLPIYNPQMQDRTASGASRIKYKYSDRRHFEHINLSKDTAIRQEKRLPGSVLKFNRETGLHPTQKPVALFEYLIKTYTNEGEVVLDNCIGSGTTAIAALNTNRQFIGIEKDPTYHQLACKRVEDWYNEPRQLAL